MTHLLAVALDAQDPAWLASFWARLLGRAVVAEPRGALLPGNPAQVDLRFVASTSTKDGPNDLHLHLTSEGDGGQRQVVETALDLGATHLDVGQRPDEQHVVLADPEGNEFCVIEPGNTFLAGCGPLGEVACDGSRAVGVFWSRALDWPLVWDQDDETAVQSPRGGTKIAWGGAAALPARRSARQWLEVRPVHGDVEAEAARLVSLGATRLPGGTGAAVAMTDPDGARFLLRAR